MNGAAIKQEVELGEQALVVSGLSKRFGEVQALNDIYLEAAPGEIIAVCGPSGAGKSTLGRLISGLEVGDAGSIRLGGKELTALPPQRRRIAHMFESLALYPTLDVFSNVASPLQAPSHKGLFDAAEIRRRVDEVLDLTDIAHLASRRPAELSGGQKQRVALCRTLVQAPDLFILDEPIGHLDAKLRHRLRGEIRRRQRALDKPTLWLTPDTLEGMAVADRVVMLVDGQVRQVGTPHQVYSAPCSTSVARLVGDPAMNLLDIWLKQEDGELQALCNGERMTLPANLMRRLVAQGKPYCTLGFPPLHTGIAGTAAAGSVRAEIYAVEPFGKYSLVTADIHGARVKAKMPADFQAPVGDIVHIAIAAEHTLLFDHDSGQLAGDPAPDAAPSSTPSHRHYEAQ